MRIVESSYFSIQGEGRILESGRALSQIIHLLVIEVSELQDKCITPQIF